MYHNGAWYLITCAGKPVIGELQSIIEARGMSATLLCRSHGNPPPIVTFQRVQPFKNTTYRSGQLYVSQPHFSNAANCIIS